MTEKQNSKSENAERRNVAQTDWHTAFQSAMQLELRANKKDLTYYREYELTKKPMRIDFLVIRKNKAVKLENEIGQFFRTYNIMEYKSPGQPLNIDTLYKVLGYGCIYKAESGKHVNEIAANEVTISLVREEKPRELLKQLEKEEYEIEKQIPGIYIVNGLAFPVQIIASQELREETHVCLKALTKKLTVKQIEDILAESKTLKDKEDEQNFASVLEVMWKTSKKELQKKKGEDHMAYEALMEMFEEEINEKVKQQLSTVKEEERIISIWTVLKNGGTDELAKKYLNATNEELEKAHQYKQEKE